MAAPITKGPPVRPGIGAPTYRVTYRVDAGVPLGTTVRTEILEVSRPWQSRLTTRSGKPPGHAVTDVQIGDFGKLDLKPVGQTESVLVLQPDLAASDLRLDVDLPTLVRAHGIELRERRLVAGQACQVYRTTAPPQGQTIGALPSATGDVVDSCVSQDGIVLEQLQWFRSKLLLRRRATRVEPGVTFGPHELEVTRAPTIPTSLGGGSVVQLDPAGAANVPGTTYFLDHPPAGFAFQGHYAVAPSTGQDSNGLPNTNRQGSFVDVWVRGQDVLMLDQGGLVYNGDPLPSYPLASAVDLGPLGRAKASPGARLSAVAVSLPSSRYVRILGTLPVDQLADIARTLRRADH